MKLSNDLSRRLLCLATALLLTVLLVACAPTADGNEESPDGTEPNETAETTASAAESETAPRSHDDGKQSGVIELPKIPF